MFVCMYALACMLCLIWGCDALVLRRQEALAAPSWARSCLTIEECCRGHTASAFLSVAPHATHAHMKVTNIYSAVKKNTNKTRLQAVLCACVFLLFFFYRKLACVCVCVQRGCKYRGSISVDCIYCCDMLVFWRPRASLRGLGSSG